MAIDNPPHPVVFILACDNKPLGLQTQFLERLDISQSLLNRVLKQQSASVKKALRRYKAELAYNAGRL